MSPVGPLVRAHVPSAVATITRAFADDPMFAWIEPNAARRSASMVHLNRIPVEYGLRWGHVTQAHDGRAVAIWMPPGVAITATGLIRCGMLMAPLRLGLGPFGRFVAANETMERIHKKYVREPHWYLMILAVDPALHGRGIGTALLHEGLASADAEQRACYLETSQERNLPLYSRAGFEVLEATTLGRGGPSAWAMRRGPRG